MARSQHAEPVDFGSEDPVAVVGELTGGVGADRVIGPTAWEHGSAPSQAARWTVESVAKAGSIGIIGVYPPTVQTWPIGAAMNKNLTVKMGNCPFDRRESGWVKVALAPVA